MGTHQHDYDNTFRQNEPRFSVTGNQLPEIFSEEKCTFFLFFLVKLRGAAKVVGSSVKYITDKAQGGASCEISECRPKACSSLMVARQIIGANGCGALQNGPSLLASSASHSVT